MSWYRSHGKRMIDLAVAVPLLVVSAPIQLGVAAAVYVTMGRPVLFRQSRAGLHHEPFELLKFRTMRTPDPQRGIVTDEQRLTKVGSWLRSASLDELPSLINVVRGDISLVGPRPLYTHYVPRYSATQARRHEVRPGITGLAQVSGRNAVDWEERFAYDVHYVDTVSLWTDLKILVRTVTTVLQRDGIAAEGHVTMHEFQGSGADADSAAGAGASDAPGEGDAGESGAQR